VTHITSKQKVALPPEEEAASHKGNAEFSSSDVNKVDTCESGFKGWWNSSSGKAPCLASPEFKPQYCQKKKKVVLKTIHGIELS
jgi:hypothetical protein